jgi:hypothetical protein
MAFFEAAGGDSHEAGLGAELVEGIGTHIAHARTKAADELENDFSKRALEGHTSLDAFRHELAGAILTVAVPCPFAHGFEAAHATVFFEGAPLPFDHVAGAFGRSSEEGAEHDEIGTTGEGFDDVA